MRKILTILISFISFIANGQTPTYRWVSGSQESREKSNLVLTEPGPRNGLSSFTDTEGNFWLFGGNGSDFTKKQGFLNDTWKFDQSSGEWEWVSGQMSVDQPLASDNNSLSFDGVDDIIELNDNPLDYTQDLTIEVWFKPTQDGVIMSHSRDNISDDFTGWNFQIVNNGESFWIIRECCLEAQINGLNLFDEEWHHLAVAFEKGDNLFVRDKLTVYLDEIELVQEFRALVNSGTDVSSHKTFIGGFKGDNDEVYFTGQIDEVRFWDYPRNRGEIISNRTIELSGSEEGLVAYYNFNQGIINSAGNNERELIDATGSINGTLNDNISRDGVFIGEMAKVRTWSQMLSQSEIQAAAKSNLSGGEPNLEVAYNFDDGIPNGDNTSQTSVISATATNEGFLNGFALIGTASNFGQSKLKVIPKTFPSVCCNRAIVTADLNGDPFDDVVTVNFNSQSINVNINDQAGGLNPFVGHSIDTYGYDLAVGFFNEDAFLDIAAVGWGVTSGDERVRLFFGDGTGDFSSTTDIILPEGSEPIKIEAIDVNNDTFDDLIVLLAGPDQVNVFYGDGFGVFPASATFDLLGEHYNEGFLVDDFTNDGYPDIAVPYIYQGNCGEIGILINDQNGAFSDQPFFPISGCIFASEIASTDFNNDGNLDIVLYNGGSVSAIPGAGDGTFLEEDLVRQTFDDGDYFTGFTLLDLNSDNVQDIVATSPNDGTITILEGNSKGEFIKTGKVNIQYSPQGVITSDLN